MNYNLLSDQPLKSETDFESAKFGHKEIAETLTSLIINCPTPFTIGLFGRWGVGKSTISYMLEKPMIENKVGFVLFDVWKHESDALRRTFLKELVNQLKGQKNIQEDFNLEERLYSKITRRVEGQFPLKDFIKKHSKLILCISLYILLIGIFIYNFLGIQYLKSYVSIVLSIVTGGGVLATIVSKMMSHFLTSETITHEVDRFKDPHEFQSEFEKILSALKTERMLVIFDNLDRVTHEKAVGILATIKTFLGTENVKNKGVVFFIPCDDRAIKEHLKGVYKLSDGEKEAFSEEEFLRKFFNTTLRIPNFYPTELESYAMDLLNQTEIAELKEGTVAWLVTKAYRQNPRQIKQFINQLISMYILAKKRIEKNSLPADFLSGNIAKLAKFLILNNKFPKQMEGLRQKKIWDLEQIPRDLTIVGDPDFAEFNKFLKETSQIPINNLNIFFTLRRSEFEVQLPGYDEFAAALQDNRIDEATSYMQALTEFSAKKATLSQAIKKLLEETNLPDTEISIINSCLTALYNINERLEDEVYIEIINKLSNLKQYLYIIEPKVVSEQLLKHYPNYRDNFAQTYVELIAQTEDKTKVPIKFVEAMVSEIIKNESWFKGHIEKISNVIADKYYDQPQIIRLLLVNEQTQQTFTVGKILQKTLSTLSLADLESGKPFDEKIKLLIDTMPDIIDKQLTSITLTRLREILTNENTKPVDPLRLEIQKLFSKGLISLLQKHISSISTKTEQAEKDSFYQTIYQAVNRIGNWEQKSIYIEPLILLSKIGIAHSAQAISMVTQFIANTAFKGLSDAFENRDDEGWNVLLSDDNYKEQFTQKALKERQIFDHLYKYLTELQKEEWLLALLDIDPMEGINKIELLGSDVPSAENVLKKLMTTSEKVDIANRFKIYEICDKLKFAGSNELLNKACENAIKYATTIDEASQKLGYEISVSIRSFNNTHKRDIARKIIEWVDSLPIAQKYQPLAIKTVLYLWNTLKEQTTSQRDFVESIFKLLVDSKNEDAIKQGIEALKVTKPKHEQYESFYEDLKHRIESEQNIALKEIFIQGFKELKKTVGKNIDWWRWIDSMEEKI